MSFRVLCLFVYLCHCQHDNDVYKYQGAEIHVLSIDELTHFSERVYRFLRNRTRMVGIELPEHYRGKFPRILCGANPGNIGHLWVKNTFILGVQPIELSKPTWPQSLQWSAMLALLHQWGSNSSQAHAVAPGSY
jgi:hypothetical protein